MKFTLSNKHKKKNKIHEITLSRLINVRYGKYIMEYIYMKFTLINQTINNLTNTKK
jgi:hypothetical protein